MIITGHITDLKTSIVILAKTEGILLSTPQTMLFKRLAEIEDYFDYKLDKRLIFIIYNKQAEYQQSNIGLVLSLDVWL